MCSESASPLRFDCELPLDDAAECERLARTVAERLRPRWFAAERDGGPAALLELHYFSEGITNKIFRVRPAAADDGDGCDALVFRVYGRNTDLLVDREAEVRTWQLLAAHRCAAPLLARFANGLVCGYVPGRPLRSVDEARRPDVSKLIAESMGRMHAIGYDSGGGGGDARPTTSALWHILRRFVDAWPAKFDEAHKQAKFAQLPAASDLLSEIALLAEILDGLHLDLVFSHNDLLLNNILFDQQTDSVAFIDYEYGCVNYRPFDIANHFIEFAGLDTPVWSNYPEREFQLRWIGHYLEQCCAPAAGRERKAAELYDQVQLMQPLSHLFWSCWAVAQAANSTIDFDYAQYAVERMELYQRMKARILGMSSRD